MRACELSHGFASFQRRPLRAICQKSLWIGAKGAAGAHRGHARLRPSVRMTGRDAWRCSKCCAGPSSANPRGCGLALPLAAWRGAAHGMSGARCAVDPPRHQAPIGDFRSVARSGLRPWPPPAHRGAVGCARARRVGHVPSIRRDRRMPRAQSDRRHANGPPPANRRPAGVAERAVDQSIDWPPLAEIVDPVMKPASSDTRNTTQRAISSGSPRRPTGMPPMIISRTFSGTAITMSVAM